MKHLFKDSFLGDDKMDVSFSQYASLEHTVMTVASLDANYPRFSLQTPLNEGRAMRFSEAK